MSIDERLREGLARNGYADPVAPEPALDLVLRRNRAIVRRRVVGLAVAAMAAGAMVPWLWGVGTSGQDPADRVPDELVGTYRVDVPTSAGARVAGRWTITLDADGRVTLDPPPGLPERTDASVDVDDGVLETDVLADTDCALPGTTAAGRYRWELSGSTISFEVLEDGCRIRRELFSRTWEEGQR